MHSWALSLSETELCIPNSKQPQPKQLSGGVFLSHLKKPHWSSFPKPVVHLPLWMQQNYTNTQTERGKKERDHNPDSNRAAPCLVNTAPGVESCKMSPVSPALCCLFQVRRWPDTSLPWACPFTTVPCQVSFVWFGKLPPAVPTAKENKKELLLSFFLVVLFQHYYSCYFPIYIFFFSLACFRSVSYRETEQKRREKALGFLEHE